MRYWCCCIFCNYLFRILLNGNHCLQALQLFVVFLHVFVNKSNLHKFAISKTFAKYQP